MNVRFIPALWMIGSVAVMPWTPAVSASGMNKEVLDLLHARNFKDAEKAARANLVATQKRASAGSGDELGASRDLVIASFVAKDKGFDPAAQFVRDFRPSAAEFAANPEAATDLLGLQLLLPGTDDANAGAVRAFERRVRLVRPASATLGSHLCSAGLAAAAVGEEHIALRVLAAAAAVHAADDLHPQFKDACDLDRAAYTRGEWGARKLEDVRDEALDHLTGACRGTFASVAAQDLHDQSLPGSFSSALSPLRLVRLRHSLRELGSTPDAYFRPEVDGWRAPLGRFALLTGCATREVAGIGVLLLQQKAGQPEEDATSDRTSPALGEDPSKVFDFSVGSNPVPAFPTIPDAKERMSVAADLLARADLLRNGVIVSGQSFQQAGSLTSSLTATAFRLGNVFNRVRTGLTGKDAIGEGMDKMQAFQSVQTMSLDSLMALPQFQESLDEAARTMQTEFDRATGDEFLVNPKVPFLDWAATEGLFGCGLGADTTHVVEAWKRLEAWRSLNVRKFISLGVIASMDASLSAGERMLVRQQMTVMWELFIARTKIRKSEDWLDHGAALDVEEVSDRLARMDEREREFEAIGARMEKISDSPALRDRRRKWMNESLARADVHEPAALSSLLPPSTLLVFLSVTNRATTVVAALNSKDGKSLDWSGYRLRLGRAEITAAAAELLSTGDSGRSVAEVRAAGSALFEKLFPPGHIRGQFARCERVVFAPNGSAGDIPFGLLAWSGFGTRQFLALERPVDVTESAGLLHFLASGAAAVGGTSSAALVAGDPATSSIHDRFSDLQIASPGGLKGAAEEATGIASTYAVTALEGTSASESRVRAGLTSARVIHLAAHGFAPPDSSLRVPLSAGVWLAGDCPADHGAFECDGVLQAWEVMTGTSMHCALTVLSGCKTGRLWNQMGTVGELARSLNYAGSRAVVVSQWDVDDRATTPLMEGLHRRVAGGVAPDIALMESMRVSAANQPPRSWAAFRCVGVGWN